MKLYKTNNECFSFVQWNKYFNSMKDEMYHSTRLSLVEWNISSFTSWKYLYHCTHKHSLFVYYITHTKIPEIWLVNNCHLLFNPLHSKVLVRVHKLLFHCTLTICDLRVLFTQWSVNAVNKHSLLGRKMYMQQVRCVCISVMHSFALSHMLEVIYSWCSSMMAHCFLYVLIKCLLHEDLQSLFIMLESLYELHKTNN